MTNHNQYDFIIVGAGPSGCTLAWRLANTSSRPSVLLIEAGGTNDDVSARVDGDRWISKMNASHNYGYKTTPQKNLNNRTIDYDRGKGLGGSSAINFACYTVGPAGDYDEIARLVGDNDFAWTNVSHVMKRLETFSVSSIDFPDNVEKYLKPQITEHGTEGPLKIGFAKKWEPTISNMLDICEEAGIPLNSDMNSGNPIGIGITPNTAFRGLRSTAADFLMDCPANLVVQAETAVHRLLFEGTKCVGVEADTQNYYASSEVILSCGSLDSPRILLHSGIGPTQQLKTFGIPIRIDLPGVGQTLRDHQHVFISWERAPHTTKRTEYYRSQDLQDAAREQWTRDRTGPLADFGTTVAFGWLKNQAIADSKEYTELSDDTKRHLSHPTVPNCEIGFGFADIENLIDPANTPTLFTTMVFLMNPQSVGQVELQSADPHAPLTFNPSYLSHSYDKRVAIEGTRELLRIAKQPSFLKDTIALRTGPASESDEDILAFWKKNATSTWHMSSTLAMGVGHDESSNVCTNNNFQVLGAENLRVVDMSVCPIIMNCHTQAVAYILGLIAGDKLVRQYNLDK